MTLKKIAITYFALHILLFINGKLTPGIKWNFVGGFVVCFCLTIFCVKRFNNNNPSRKILFTLILIRLFLFGGYDLYVRLTEELYGSPILVIELLGIVSGFYYLRLKNPSNLLPLVFSSAFVAFMFFQGWDFYMHKAMFGSFTNKITPYKLQQKVEGITQYNQQITNQTLENKIVLLDFWNTTCGYCFQAFPQLQSFYNEHKTDASIVVLAVDKPLEEDIGKSPFKVIEEKGFTFPVLLPADEELPEKFDVKSYPTTFVINRNGQIVYKGDIEGAIKMVDQLKSNFP